MRYQTTVPNIHCDGCIGLISTILEDHFDNIAIDKETKLVTFESEKDSEEVKEILNELFEELRPHGYDYIEFSLAPQGKTSN